ncbi:hypothetical protein FJY63_03970 [Candidatus Sumerlaeota bacterium]|nr:hypothetical protein [Candidatus Sumerlaeota bacterium]
MGSPEKSPDDHGYEARKANIRRRDFLKTVCSVPVAMAAAKHIESASASPADKSKLPQIAFGKYSFSRLILGSNPFHAGSHLSVFVNREMNAYYTTEQKLKTIRRCQEVGINCWQGSGDHHEVYRLFRESGGQMHYITLTNEGPGLSKFMETMKEIGCLGIAHHGEVTDRAFKTGEIDTIRDFLKKVRDAGFLVGLSTHMPDVVDYVESKGWDVDYYMTCVYERHRDAKALEKLLGHVPIPVGEVYLESDPPRMHKAMRQTKRPCLAFKILAAGRLSERKERVEQAFRRTFDGIKPNDAVIVGIYDRYSDQQGEDAEYTRRFSPLSGKA